LVSVRAGAAGQLELSWLCRGGMGGRGAPPCAGGFGGSSPRVNTACGYHDCITSPVWHWRDVAVTVQ
jgi:hypothetical protein